MRTEYGDEVQAIGADEMTKPIVYTPEITCSCGEVHLLHVTPATTMVLIPCQCGALLRWAPGALLPADIEPAKSLSAIPDYPAPAMELEPGRCRQIVWCLPLREWHQCSRKVSGEYCTQHKVRA